MLIAFLFLFFLYNCCTSACSNSVQVPSEESSWEVFDFYTQYGINLIVRNLYIHFLEKDDSLKCLQYAAKVYSNLLEDLNYSNVKDQPEFVGAMASIARSYLNEKVLEMDQENLKKVKRISVEFIERMSLDSAQLLYFWFAYNRQECEVILPHFHPHVKMLILIENAKKAIGWAKKYNIFSPQWLDGATQNFDEEIFESLKGIKQFLLA